jgi:hypothetical protein
MVRPAESEDAKEDEEEQSLPLPPKESQ